jgi:hypothetical protein
MGDVSFEVLDHGTRRPDCACLEVPAETPCHLLCGIGGARVVSVDVYGFGTEGACGETDVCREAFVTLGAVSETEYLGSFVVFFFHVRDS